MTLLNRMMRRQVRQGLQGMPERLWGGLWRLVWRVAKVVVYLSVTFVLALAVLLVHAGVVPGRLFLYKGLAGSTFDPHRYWQALMAWRSLTWAQIAVLYADVAAAARVTGTLLTTSFVLTVLAGVLAGYLLSRYGPRRGRRTAWAAVTILSTLPDILLVVALQLGFYWLAQAVGLRIPVYGAIGTAMTWKHYLLPVIALTLLPLPYLARVVASALEESGGQRYVQAAMARGVPWRRVLWRHIGPNALLRILAALPGVLGVLLSAGPVVEYMTALPGLGQRLLNDAFGYYAAFSLLPLLLAISLINGLTGVVQERLNPLQHLPLESGPVVARQTLREWAAALLGTIAEVGRLLWAQICALRTAPGRLWRAIRANPTLLCGVVLTLLLLFVAMAAEQLAPYPFTRREMLRIQGETYLTPPFAPSATNRFGSDGFGRDILSGLIWGTRYALLIAFLAVPVRFAISLPLGLVAATRRGLTERAVRTLAGVFTSLPAVLLPLALIPDINSIWLEQPGVTLLLGILVLALPGAPRLAEAIRLAAREILSSPYLEGGRAVGASPTRLLLRYVLPNIAPTVTVLAALEVPLVLTTTAFLGMRHAYIGGSLWDPDARVILGAVLPEWGSMLESPFLMFLSGRWWYWWPFAAISVAVLAFTLLGEGIRRQTVTHQTWG